MTAQQPVLVRSAYPVRGFPVKLTWAEWSKFTAAAVVYTFALLYGMHNIMLGIERRLVVIETKMEGVASTIGEMKSDVKELRQTRTSGE